MAYYCDKKIMIGLGLMHLFTWTPCSKMFCRLYLCPAIDDVRCSRRFS